MLWWMVAHALAEPVSIGLGDALTQAVRHNPQVEAAGWATEHARAQAQGARSAWFPAVRLSAGVQWWNDAIEAQVVDPDAGTLPTTLTSGPFAEVIAPLQDTLAELSEPITIREARTSTLTAQAVMPVTGLWAIGEGHTAARAQWAAAKAGEAATRADVLVLVVSAYTDALAAGELVGVADTSVTSLTSALSRVRAFEDAGLAQRSDALQIEVALRNAEQAARQARRAKALAQRRLAVLVGHDAPALVPLPIEAALSALPSLEDGLRGLDQRPDVRQADHQLDAARAGRRAQTARLLPQVAAVAQVEQLGGAGALAAANQRFVGVQAEFDLWGWGGRTSDVRAATAQMRQAEIGRRAARDRADLEARAAFDALANALDQVGVADVQVAQAEESLRFIDARFDVQLVSTTERLQAERLVQQARIARTQARHQALAAHAAWRRATGQPIAETTL